MSLINDALKKAQKQRTGEAPPLASLPGVGGESAASISRSGKSSGANPLMIGGGIPAAVLVLTVGGWFAFRGKPESGSGGPASPRAVSGQETAAAGEKNGPQGRGPSRETAASPQVSAQLTTAS